MITAMVCAAKTNACRKDIVRELRPRIDVERHLGHPHLSWTELQQVHQDLFPNSQLARTAKRLYLVS